MASLLVDPAEELQPLGVAHPDCLDEKLQAGLVRPPPAVLPVLDSPLVHAESVREDVL